MTDTPLPQPPSPAPPSTPTSSLPIPPRPRRRWVTVAAVLGIFVLGTVVGSAVTVMVVVHKIRYALHHPDEFPDRLASQLRWKLTLSHEQEQDVAQVLTRHQKNLQALRREVQPKVETELHSVQIDVGKVLNPSQREKWDAMFGKLMRDWVPPAPGEPGNG